MSRLEKLIQQLCPDGVEYKTLEELFLTRNGYTPSRANPEYWRNGTIPWFRMEDIRTNGRILTQALQYVSDKAIKDKPFPANSIIVATSATVGEHALLTVASLANQRFTYLILKEQYKSQFDIKFLYYYCFKLDKFCLQHLKLGNFASVDMSKFAKFQFPVPPLEVQQEIVRILDHFTELTAELTEKLTAELTAREKQYQYYRCQLLTFNSSVPRRTLSEVCNILSGGDAPKNEMSKEKTEHYKIPIISNGVEGNDIYGYTNIKKIDTPAVTIAARGTIGYAAYRDYPYFPIIRLLSAIPKDISLLDTKFLYYCLRDKQYNIPQSGIPQLTSPQLKKVEIPLPPLPEQHRIVSILDRFDALCNDLTSGLPAEIAARQKQYEYYRDKLLTFPRQENQR